MATKFSADLIEWALVRVTIGEQVSTHAVGCRTRDVVREGGYVLTSPVREIDRDRGLLTTRTSRYELRSPIDDYPADLFEHWIKLVVMRAKRARDRIEFLKSDGSVVDPWTMRRSRHGASARRLRSSLTTLQR